MYVDGFSMSPLAQVTEVDQGGGVDDEVTADQDGSPERLVCIRGSIEGAIEEHT